MTMALELSDIKRRWQAGLYRQANDPVTASSRQATRCVQAMAKRLEKLADDHATVLRSVSAKAWQQ